MKTNDFISNINKTNQKPVELISAHTGKRKHSKDDLNVTIESSCLFIAVICAIGFITYIAIGG